MSTARRKPPTLAKRTDFLRVQARGQRFRGRLVTLLALPSEADGLRVGYTVSRKVGNAVVRNRVRRKLREIVRLAQASFPSGFDYVLIASPAAATASYAELARDVHHLLPALQRFAKSRHSAGVGDRP